MPVVPQRSSGKVWLLSILLLVLAMVGSVSYIGYRQSVPGVRASVASPPRFIGRKTTLTVTLAAAAGSIARAEVRVVQGGRTTVVLKQETPLGPRVDMPIMVEGATLGLREGGATVEVWARDDYWRPLRFDDRALLSFPVTVDLTPPAIEVLAATQYLYQGGGGLVAFRVKGGDQGQVRAGAFGFGGFPVGNTGVHVALIGLPWDMALDAPLTISAQDEAGNSASRGIPSEVRPRRFPKDTIDVKDSFLETKVPELLPQHPPGAPLIDGFLVINRDRRRQAEEEKRRIARKTADRPLWEGAFVQPRNTKVFSNFAETRVYSYRGKEIDTQVHLGYDLASVRQTPVPAANKGVVAFAGPLTIYGNTVVVDHGLGLQTLYGHLSRIDVKPGDAVERGQELGRSGSTGLAGGDHIHFEVLIGGISVTPVEWWDAKWIRDHIDKPLREAGLPEISGLESTAADAPPPEPRRPRSKARR